MCDSASKYTFSDTTVPSNTTADAEALVLLRPTFFDESVITVARPPITDVKSAVDTVHSSVLRADF